MINLETGSGRLEDLVPGLCKAQVKMNLTAKGDIVVNFVVGKDRPQATLWLNDPSNKEFKEVVVGDKTFDVAFKEKMYTLGIVNAIKQIFVALTGSPAEWEKFKSSQSSFDTLTELYGSMKEYLELNFSEYWKKRVFVALTARGNSLTTANYSLGKNNNYYYDNMYNNLFVSDKAFDVVHFENFKNTEIEVEESGFAPAPSDW